MAKEKGEVSYISITLNENGSNVTIQRRYPDSKAYDGYKTESKTYNADKGLVDAVLKYVDDEVEEDLAEDTDDGKNSRGDKPRLVNKDLFLKKG